MEDSPNSSFLENRAADTRLLFPQPSGPRINVGWPDSSQGRIAASALFIEPKEF